MQATSAIKEAIAVTLREVALGADTSMKADRAAAPHSILCLPCVHRSVTNQDMLVKPPHYSDEVRRNYLRVLWLQTPAASGRHLLRWSACLERMYILVFMTLTLSTASAPGSLNKLGKCSVLMASVDLCRRSSVPVAQNSSADNFTTVLGMHGS